MAGRYGITGRQAEQKTVIALRVYRDSCMNDSCTGTIAARAIAARAIAVRAIAVRGVFAPYHYNIASGR